MKNIRNFHALSLIVLSFVYTSFINCNMNSDNGKTVSVTIDTGIRDGDKSVRAAAPADVISISLTVSGTDMTDISTTIPTNTGTLTLEVPIGSARTFTVTATTENTTYFGTATENITAAGPNNVTISMYFQTGATNISFATLPAGITNISLTISATGMTDIVTTIPVATGTLSLDVPAGSAILFSVTATEGNFTHLASATQDVTLSGPNDVIMSLVKQTATMNITIPSQSEYAGTVQNFIVTVGIAETSGSEQGTFLPEDTITLEVPPGNNRGVSLVTTPLSTSAVVTFSTEVSTENFTLGQTTGVTMSPSVTETKLVIPDYTNNRIVQIDNFTTPNWIEKNGNDLGLGVAFNLRPHDIDFDKFGRIYIARNEFASGEGRIYRINTMQDSAVGIYTSGFDGVQTLTLDKSVDPHVLYFTENSGNTLQRCTIDSCTPTTLANIPGTSMRGIYFYNGLLLIAYSNTFAVYNPTTQTTIDNTKSYSGGSSNEAWDMIVKGSNIYGAFYDTGGSQIFVRRFTLDVSNNLVDTTDTYTTSITGPHRFIDNLTSTTIYFIDNNVSTNQLISIDNITFTNRQTYGTTGTGVGNFDFY